MKLWNFARAKIVNLALLATLNLSELISRKNNYCISTLCDDGSTDGNVTYCKLKNVFFSIGWLVWSTFFTSPPLSSFSEKS